MSIRALHVIDPRGAGWPAVMALSALARERSGEVESVVALVGGGAGGEESCRVAAAYGLRPDLVLTAPLGRLERGGPALRGAISRLERRPDVVHAWSLSSLTMARLARTGIPLSATLSQGPPRGALGGLRGLRGWGGWGAMGARSLLLTTRVALDGWRGCALGGAHSSLLGMPMVECEMGSEARGALRGEWGVTEETVVILATGEPGERLDARWFTFRAGVLTVAGSPAAVVLPRECGSLERALRYVERHNTSWRVIIEERPLSRLLCGCDMAVWHAGARGSREEIWGAYGLALAASHGLPCVGEDHALSRELLSLGNAPRLVPAGESVALSRAMFDVADEVRAGSNRGMGRADSTVGEWISRMSNHLMRTAGIDAAFGSSEISRV